MKTGDKKQIGAALEERTGSDPFFTMTGQKGRSPLDESAGLPKKKG
ncbi:MAG: hypothetical protein IJ649_07990 [Oscillospiraceae bacterium]|nr:hypothetical protein [Oscillospiraceae bacterium]